MPSQNFPHSLAISASDNELKDSQKHSTNRNSVNARKIYLSQGKNEKNVFKQYTNCNSKFYHGQKHIVRNKDIKKLFKIYKFMQK